MKLVFGMNSLCADEKNGKKNCLLVVIAERVLVPCLFMLGLHMPHFFVSIPLFLDNYLIRCMMLDLPFSRVFPWREMVVCLWAECELGHLTRRRHGHDVAVRDEFVINKSPERRGPHG